MVFGFGKAPKPKGFGNPPKTHTILEAGSMDGERSMHPTSRGNYIPLFHVKHLEVGALREFMKELNATRGVGRPPRS